MIILLSNQFSYAQSRQYLGLKVEASAISTKLSKDANINLSIVKSFGIAGHYPLTPKLEIFSDVLFSTYKLSGDSRSYDGSSSEWNFNGIKSFNIKSFDGAYGIRRGFGEEQHFKIGVGGFYDFFFGKISDLPSNEYLGKSSNIAENYDPYYLYTKANYGFFLEGIYNVNDAFQISIRFKKGLSNLYKPQANDTTWKQSQIGIGVMYYIGAGERGKINSKKSSKTKSKINF